MHECILISSNAALSTHLPQLSICQLQITKVFRPHRVAGATLTGNRASIPIALSSRQSLLTASNCFWPVGNLTVSDRDRDRDRDGE